MPSPSPADLSFEISKDFPPLGYGAWKTAVDAELEGAAFEKKLVSRLYEGVAIQPLYTGEHWKSAADPSGFPGHAPFVRGATPIRRTWEIRQAYRHPDPAATNAEILADLEGGTNGILLKIPGGGEGIDAERDLATVLRGVKTDAVSISIDAGPNFLAAAALLAAHLRKIDVEATAMIGFGADPLGALAREGNIAAPGIEAALADLGALAGWSAVRFPNAIAARVSTAAYHDACSTVTQDLAFAMATGIAYLRAMTGAGLSIDAACRQIEFSFSVGTNFFRAIAKLRAARRLWGRIAEASGASPEAGAMRMHVLTAARAITQRDPWVNILRETVACFAGAVAGADSITVEPYDVRLRPADENARRLARNTQLILAEESNLAAVMDPAGGCWFLEKLTDEMAVKAWAVMQEIEAQGGMTAALTSGWVAETIEASWTERRKNIARRKDAITGVSEFPNLREKSLKATSQPASKRQPGILPSIRLQAAAARRGEGLMDALVEAAIAGETLSAMTAALGAQSLISPLPHRFYAAPFEILRDASDAALAINGKRPRVALINLGPLAHHSARASWSTNFFEAGGLEAIPSEPLNDDAAVKAAFERSGAAIAVICSSDKIYGERAADAAKALKEAGARTVILAGNPGENREVWTAAGVDLYIHIGCDVLEILTTLMRQEGALA